MNVNKIIVILTILLWCWLIQNDTTYHLHQDHYYVCISPEFSISNTSYIMDGVGIWNQFGENRFYLATKNDLCDLLITPATGTVAQYIESALNDPHILGYADLNHHTIYLFITKIYGKDDLVTITTHEAGHFIGLEHIAMDRFAIMNPYKRYYGYIHPNLFRADIEAYCRKWPCHDVDINLIQDTVSYGSVSDTSDDQIIIH